MGGRGEELGGEEKGKPLSVHVMWEKYLFYNKRKKEHLYRNGWLKEALHDDMHACKYLYKLYTVIYTKLFKEGLITHAINIY